MSWSAPNYSKADSVRAWETRLAQQLSEQDGCCNQTMPNSAQLQKRAEVAQSYQNLIRACRAHSVLLSGEAAPKPMDNSLRLELQPRWHEYFEMLNEELQAGVSITDVGLKAICMSLFYEDPSIHTEMDLSSVSLAFVYLVIVACQHTPESRLYWPDADEWRHIKRLLVGVITIYFDCGPEYMAGLIARIDSPGFSFDSAPLSDTLRKQYQSRFMPPALAEILRKQKRAIELKRKQGVSNIKDSVSEESSGAIWRNTADELVRNFVSRTARVMHKVEFDNTLVARHPSGNDTVRITSVQVQAARKWVLDRLKCEQPEEISELFRTLALQWSLPMGWETLRYRSKETASDIEVPMTTLSAQIGLNLASMLSDEAMRPLKEVAEDSNSMHWDALFLALFDYCMKQRVRLDWCAVYFSTQPQSAATRARMESPMLANDSNKRPMVIQAQRRFWLFHHNCMEPFGGLVHAVLAWLHVAATQFGCIMENRENVEEVYRMFFPDASSP